MKDFLDKKVWIKIKAENGFLFFTATVTSVTDTHITFVDKYDEKQMFLISDVVQIKELKERGEDSR